MLTFNGPEERIQPDGAALMITEDLSASLHGPLLRHDPFQVFSWIVAMCRSGFFNGGAGNQTNNASHDYDGLLYRSIVMVCQIK